MDDFQFDQDFPIPASYMIELGRMMALWGSLESTVVVSISKLAGYEETLDYRALILVNHSNFQQKIDIISTLCEQLLPDHPNLANYQRVISKIREAQTLRNRFAHNGLSLNEETGDVETSRATARGKLKTYVATVALEDLVAASASIHEAICVLFALVTGKPMEPIWNR